MRQIHGKKQNPLSPFLNFIHHTIPIVIIVLLTGYMWYTNNEHTVTQFLSDTSATPAPEEKTPYSELSQCILNREKETFDKDISYAKGSLIIQFYKTVPQADGIEMLFDYKDLQIIHEIRSINGFSIGVPLGREFEYMCRLELDNKNKVQSVQLNSLDSAN